MQTPRREPPLVEPDDPETASPVDPQRGQLYSADELYDVTPYPLSLDARAFGWSTTANTPQDAQTRALHDDSIERALTSWLAGKQVVGVMGGHGPLRGDDGFRQAARLGQALATADLVVATGGGPGLMEAVNLGAWLGDRSAADLDHALATLGKVEPTSETIDEWVSDARAVLAQFPGGRESLGIPTWFYGSEPTNLFATSIAKYFKNALREAELLKVCTTGIVYLPGQGGTVQEIFQDACENYYAGEDPGPAEMVLVGTYYWAVERPAWQLVQKLAEGRPMEAHIHLVDTVDEAAAIIATQATVRSPHTG